MLVKTEIKRYENDGQLYGYFKLFKKGDVENIKAKEVHFCCNDMREAFDEGFCGFGEKDSSGLNKNNNVNVYNCAPYPEGAVWSERPITFCPFCGEKVHVSEVDSET